MANVGFVGLGVMGSEMALRLLEKGHSVSGYNRTRAKAERLIQKGMKWAESPRAVAAGADVVISMVSNSAALGAIAGAAAGGGKGAAIGAGVGGGLGTGAGLLMGRNIRLNKGQALDLRLDHDLFVPRG